MINTEYIIRIGSMNKFPYLELRLFIAIVVSIIMIISDLKYNMSSFTRKYVEDALCAFYYLYDRQVCALNCISKLFIGYKKLILENDALRRELILKNNELLLIDQYKQENNLLYKLFNVTVCNNYRKLIAKILSINTDPCNQQIIIDQGSNNEVYIGQPVFSDVGVVGQVISVTDVNSRVLLISDSTHALPVKVQRNNARMILIGKGYNAKLYAEYYGNADICVNDILITSGLDGQFPEGYPVATVSRVQVDVDKDCTLVQAVPMIKPQDLYYIVLIWK